jgi:drug/metabolite transporter (DMT)-like permease
MIVAVLTGGISLPVFGFSLPNWNDIILFATAGIMVSVSHLLIIQALLFAPGSTVAPFKYLSLVYAAGIGYIVWGDVPNIGKIMGAALVVLAGLFILYREMNAKKSLS